MNERKFTRKVRPSKAGDFFPFKKRIFVVASVDFDEFFVAKWHKRSYQIKPFKGLCDVCLLAVGIICFAFWAKGVQGFKRVDNALQNLFFLAFQQAFILKNVFACDFFHRKRCIVVNLRNLREI